MGLELLKAANSSSPVVLAWWLMQVQGWAWGWGQEPFVFPTSLQGPACAGFWEAFQRLHSLSASWALILRWLREFIKTQSPITLRYQVVHFLKQFFLFQAFQRHQTRELSAACSCCNEKDRSGPERFPVCLLRTGTPAALCFPAQGLMLRKALWAQS